MLEEVGGLPASGALAYVCGPTGLVHGGGRTWLDLRGVRCLELAET